MRSGDDANDARKDGGPRSKLNIQGNRQVFIRIQIPRNRLQKLMSSITHQPSCATTRSTRNMFCNNGFDSEGSW